MVRSLLIDGFRLTVWLVVLAVIFIPIERIFELAPNQRSRKATLVDLGFYFLNSLLPAFVLTIPAAALIAISSRFLPDAYVGWLDDLPIWAVLLATFVVGEIGFYWGHRWSHEWPLMWRFHAVHHSPAGMDWLVNTRAHPIDMVFGKLCGLVPIYLLGLSGRGNASGSVAAVAVLLVGTVWGFFIHANVRWRFGLLEKLVASPRFHHWHHSKEEHINRNYAAMLPIMDRVFGTLHLPRHDWPKAYGISETAGITDRIASGHDQAGGPAPVLLTPAAR
jgi:sterol desaturase/sphingolipid hydroxylase (fatty acid hydroxylase superfamily)